MREPHTFCKSTPHRAWILVALAGLILLPGSPLILRSKAGPKEPVDPATIESKLAELERACAGRLDRRGDEGGFGSRQASPGG